MTEDRFGFLCNVTCNLSSNNNSLKMLRSYYLMRCNELTKGYGLPPKFFSTKVRCPHCYLEWSKNTEVKVQPLKVRKKQQQKMWSQKAGLNRNSLEERRALLHLNQMVQICSFCKQSTTTRLTKPEKEYIKSTTKKEENEILISKNPQTIKKASKKPEIKRVSSNTKPSTKKSTVVNVYSNAFDVFSLKNEENTFSSAIKESSKAIKNKKKKKDKYAGLCQKAVLASAKLKQKVMQTQKQVPKNKLNLFLKLSSG